LDSSELLDEFEMPVFSPHRLCRQLFLHGLDVAYEAAQNGGG
jgi:hypothetical protein